MHNLLILYLNIGKLKQMTHTHAYTYTCIYIFDEYKRTILTDNCV